MNVFIDIETLPDMSHGAKDEIVITAPAQYKKPESIQKWIDDNGDGARDEIWRKGALSADNGGSILTISFSIDGGEIQTLSRNDDDLDMLNAFSLAIASSMNGRSPYFVGHNVPFDLQFIWKRAVINGVILPFRLKPHGRHGSDFYDTMQAWAGFKGRISQDRLAKLLGLDPKPSDINGSNVLDHYLAGNIEKIIEYNRYDVQTVIDIYNRINNQ